MEHVILVDEHDREVGTEEKMEAHRKGKLHRAFSVFVFNDRHEMLLQKRADSKYHCPELWTNTCCSHPRPGEGVLEAAHRRLPEEMGFDCDLSEIFSFTYRSEFQNGLIEHEFDHVLIGHYNEAPQLNPEEASDFRWMDQEELEVMVRTDATQFTPWFLLCYSEVFAAQAKPKLS